ncbi:unnamed protein product, partial [Callosobruchus maculatus]
TSEPRTRVREIAKCRLLLQFATYQESRVDVLLVIVDDSLMLLCDSFLHLLKKTRRFEGNNERLSLNADKSKTTADHA